MAETVQRLTRAIATNINVPGGRQFQDPEIKEFINRAIGWAESKIRSSPMRDLRFEVEMTLPTGDTTLELPGLPIRMWEKQEGKWKEMTTVGDHLPVNAEPKDQLLWWSWEGGHLRFIGATQDIVIRVHYRGRIPLIGIPLDVVSLNGLDEVVIAKASAVGSVIGKLDQAQYWEATASELLDRFIQTGLKPLQSTGFRRKRRRISLPPWRY